MGCVLYTRGTFPDPWEPLSAEYTRFRRTVRVDIQQIRNVGIIAHGGAGKTTLAEALLFNAKATDRMGKVDDGSSNFDYDPEEIRRKITINTSFHHYAWDKVEVTLADTPGYINFEADTRSCLNAVSYTHLRAHETGRN